MTNEIAGHVWWREVPPDGYEVYLETNVAVYRCSPSDVAWRKVDASPDPRRFEFSAPLERRILKCLTGANGCRYVRFSDDTAIRIFSPPDEPGRVTIHYHAASFLNREDCERLFQSVDEFSETPIS